MVAFGHVDGGDTGVTVAYLGKDGMRASVDVRGGGPGTRETDLLEPHNTVDRVHAIVLAGGSAFGLAAADGAMRELAASEIGFAVADIRIPIVPAAVIFDLLVGPNRPSAKDGARATASAMTGDDMRIGSVGAGCGASAGKLRGGFGRHSVRVNEAGAVKSEQPRFKVSAAVVANPVGEVVDADTGLLYGDPHAPGVDPDRFRALPHPFAAQLNTTIGVIYTDAPLSKAQLKRLAMCGHDGIARAVRPAHLPMDGDSLFAVTEAASAEPEVVSTDTLAALCAGAADAVCGAIVSAIRAAGSGQGASVPPTYSELVR